MPTDAPEGPSDLETPPSPVRAPRTPAEVKRPRIQEIPVVRIRPEDGLGRKRDRQGHRELRRSIEQFGVLTPVTVRVAPDGSGDYLLIKGQGRTLACRLLGIDKIPALVVDDEFAEDAKVQQFLVENVARLRMRSMDRALLIARARQEGEETASVARRFGVAPATVRRLESQLEGASTREVAALQRGNVNLVLHAVIARYMGPEERSDAVDSIAGFTLKARELEALFEALGWKDLMELGPEHRLARLKLLTWACATLDRLPRAPIQERLGQLAAQLPTEFAGQAALRTAAK